MEGYNEQVEPVMNEFTIDVRDVIASNEVKRIVSVLSAKVQMARTRTYYIPNLIPIISGHRSLPRPR